MDRLMRDYMGRKYRALLTLAILLVFTAVPARSGNVRGMSGNARNLQRCQPAEKPGSVEITKNPTRSAGYRWNVAIKNGARCVTTLDESLLDGEELGLAIKRMSRKYSNAANIGDPVLPDTRIAELTPHVVYIEGLKTGKIAHMLTIGLKSVKEDGQASFNEYLIPGKYMRPVGVGQSYGSWSERIKAIRDKRHYGTETLTTVDVTGIGRVYIVGHSDKVVGGGELAGADTYFRFGDVGIAISALSRNPKAATSLCMKVISSLRGRRVWKGRLGSPPRVVRVVAVQ